MYGGVDGTGLMGTPDGSVRGRKMEIIPMESRPAYVCPHREISRLKPTNFCSDLNLNAHIFTYLLYLFCSSVVV